jgi:L-lactate dehydrogenase complex protein LldE
MISTHYLTLFGDDPHMHRRAVELAGRTWELTVFLREVMNFAPQGVSYAGKATYHDSCAGLRELKIKDQPRVLLESVAGLSLNESDLSETCCGFGGLFCMKYPGISGAMADRKIDDIIETGADTLLGGDLGCLMNLAGRMARRKNGQGEKIKTWHVAEVLAGMTDDVKPVVPDAGDEE